MPIHEIHAMVHITAKITLTNSEDNLCRVKSYSAGIRWSDAGWVRKWRYGGRSHFKCSSFLPFSSVYFYTSLDLGPVQMASARVCCCCLFIHTVFTLASVWQDPYSPPPLGELVSWRSSHRLPSVSADEDIVKEKRNKLGKPKGKKRTRDTAGLTQVGTFQRPWPPGSPTLPFHISSWKRAQISVRSDTFLQSSPLPSPSTSSALRSSISTGCSDDGDATVSGLPSPHSNSTCCP